MVKKTYLDINVVKAAEERIKNIFSNGVKVVLSFSGGKDSLVLGNIVYELAVRGEIDKSLLEILFIDEEAMFDEVIDHIKRWRKKWMMIGVPFSWYCIEVKHFNCLNSLSEDETFICWDRYKKDVWVREIPDFAIKDHPLLIQRVDTYQTFLERLDKKAGNYSLIGTRASESVQRLKNIAKQKSALSSGVRFFPIYDMTDKDVWAYIYNKNLEYPKVYENLYRVGTRANQLRISQFFSIDTAKVLVKLNELYPDLMERVTRREPNAYLVSLYWDSEIFGRSTRTRKEIEKKDKTKQGVNYRNNFMNLVHNPQTLDTENQRLLLDKYKKLIIKFGFWMDERMYKRIYESILAGDPKLRTYRAISVDIVRLQGVGGWAKNAKNRK